MRRVTVRLICQCTCLPHRAEVCNGLKIALLAETHHPSGTPQGYNSPIMTEGHAGDGGRGGELVSLDQGMNEHVPGLQDPPSARHNEEGLGGVGHHGRSMVHYSLYAHASVSPAKTCAILLIQRAYKRDVKHMSSQQNGTHIGMQLSKALALSTSCLTGQADEEKGSPRLFSACTQELPRKHPRCAYIAYSSFQGRTQGVSRQRPSGTSEV